MNIYVLSPLKIPFPSMAFTPKYVQMTSLLFRHHCLKFHQHLIFNMLGIELTPVPSHHTLHRASTPTSRYFSCCCSLPQCMYLFQLFLCKNNHKFLVAYNTHIYFSRSIVQQAVSASNCGLRSGLFHEFHSGAQTEEAVATWSMFFSWR